MLNNKETFPVNLLNVSDKLTLWTINRDEYLPNKKVFTDWYMICMKISFNLVLDYFILTIKGSKYVML